MVDLAFIPQDVSGLEYAFFHGQASNLERLTIISDQIFTLPHGHSIRLAIIGESHFMVLFDDKGNPIISEVLACVTGFDFGQSPVAFMNGKNLLNFGSWNFCSKFLDYEYRLELSIGNYAYHKRARSRHVVMSEAFPWEDDGQVQSPETVLALKSDAKHLFILTTKHEYPTGNGGGQVALSRSRCRLLKPKT